MRHIVIIVGKKGERTVVWDSGSPFPQRDLRKFLIACGGKDK
jgi:hypothetical protein